MKKFEVDFRDYNTGATSPIDTIEVADNYTPEQYVKDCAANDVYWGDGEIIFVEIEDEE